MAVAINPIRLHGKWDLGFALDTHVIESIPLGEDAYGHLRFESTRSPIGELLYQFKYNGRYDNLTEIVDTIKSFLSTQPEMQNIETILPVPPTKARSYQPTFEIAQALAKLVGAIVKKKPATRNHSTLLIDDLYQTGTTLNQCTSLLRDDPLVDKIYVLTITKTKNQ